jgi:glucosylceramidase
VLDQHGGPNYVNNYCHAPLLFNTETGELKKQSIYDALWHFARFLPKDSHRILSSSFSREIETTAFLRPDGSTVLILHNPGKRKKCCVSLEGMLAELTLPAKALITVEIVDA